ncbi:hypothetical protein L7F22_033149 [Adiantum nelumboides]|nr:hypothetical protein [Adiantum nelumboides]
MESVQGKLRKAFGAVKDHTSISIAKVGSAGSVPEVEIALLKATSHEETPLEEKYVQELLYVTAGSREHVDVCIASLGKRLRKTHNWIVAIKTLMLAHRLLRDGDLVIEQALTSARKKGMRVLNVHAFRDESHSNGWDFSAFVRAYGLYLDQRLEFSMPAFSPSKPPKSPGNISSCDQGHRHSSASPSASGSDDDRSRVKPHSSHRRRKPVKKMRPPELMQKFPLFQRLLERILACRPSGAAKSSRLVLFALHAIVRESFLVYSDIRDGMAILLDAFFDLEQLDCISAFDVYTKAAKQVDELISFYSICKTLGVCKATEYPTVEKISEEMLETMAASLRLRLDSTRDSSRKTKAPAQARSVSFQDEVEGEPVHESKGVFKSSPTHPYSSRPATPPRIATKASLPPKPVPVANPAVSSPGVKVSDRPNLLDLNEEPSMPSQEQEKKLELALLFGDSNSGVDSAWESFFPDVDGNVSPTSNNALEGSQGVTGWELALIDSESSIMSRPPTGSSLAGSFDQLLLDNLYDQGVDNRIRQAAASGPAGSASSVAAPSQPLSNIYALPASSAAASTLEAQVQEDPFAASINVPPPSYVQMSELRQKQQLLMQEQQQWLQYQQQANIFGYGDTPTNFPSNPFANPFQSTALPIPHYGLNSNCA